MILFVCGFLSALFDIQPVNISTGGDEANEA